MEHSPLTTLLRQRMTALDLTPDRLADILGCHRSAVYSWLAGSHPPAPNRYASIADALDMPLRDLVLAAHGAAP